MAQWEIGDPVDEPCPHWQYSICQDCWRARATELENERQKLAELVKVLGGDKRDEELVEENLELKRRFEALREFVGTHAVGFTNFYERTWPHFPLPPRG